MCVCVEEMRQETYRSWWFWAEWNRLAHAEYHWLNRSCNRHTHTQRVTWDLWFVFIQFRRRLDGFEKLTTIRSIQNVANSHFAFGSNFLDAFLFSFFSPALKVSIFDNAPAQFASNGIGGNEKHASLRTSFSQESNVRKYATEITVAAVGCLCHLRHPYKRHHRLRHNKTSTPSFSTFEFIHFGPARTPAFAVIRDGMWYAFSFEAHNITSRYNVVLHVLR